MNFTEIISQIKSRLQEIAEKEKANQQEQVEVTQKIEQLKQEIEENYRRQSELDREALDLCSLTEELTEKQQKIAKIQSFSQEFQDLQTEFQDNQDLLDTLYSSISAIAKVDNNFNLENQAVNFSYNLHQIKTKTEQAEEFNLSIKKIKAQLPQAERLYQQLVAKNLEQYHTYQNLIIDGLDLIWYSVAFVVFGKESYKQMSLRYHPDQNGSEQAMQLINTAWEISQKHLESQDKT